MPGTTNKKTKLTFLHVTDCHLTKTATVETVDRKVKAGGMSPPLRSDMLRNTLRSLAVKLKGEGTELAAVLFSGDGTFQGDPDGQSLLRDMLITELATVGITKTNLIATPGNHDVVARSEPSQPARYDLFCNAWINSDPVVVPFLDGIHESHNLKLADHVLKGPNNDWAIFPINTANWSQIKIAEENAEVSKLIECVKNTGISESIKTLEKLCTYDVARVSDAQLSALKEMVDQVGDVRLRIAVLHHHLLPVDSREEFKAFADITNLGLLRQVLRERGFQIVVHGHKHVTAAYYDHVYPDNLDLEPAHRMLTVSGGTFGPTAQHPDSPLRLIEIDGMPHAPICTIRHISSSIAGRDLKVSPSPSSYRLWEDDMTASGPTTIYGKSIDDVYARAVQSVKQAPDRTIICTVDFQQHEETPFPLSYPYGENEEERRAWFEETVRWWQLPASRIEARIPYIHGSRLKRYGGGIDQITRVVDLLRSQKETSSEKATSKAIAFVVDPVRDFINGKPFASFCFVQFCLRPDNRLDCVGYYRAQEFNHWWPVNVAELRHLQLEVAGRVPVSPGKITTITPYPRLSLGIRHPSKVAVPLIDQWVDNHPVRIAQIALALTNSTAKSFNDGVGFWKRGLDDLAHAATADYHEDGVLVSIEGLELLRDWLAATGESLNVIKLIDDLLTANRAHMGSKHMREDFERWGKQVRPILASLRNFPSPQ